MLALCGLLLQTELRGLSLSVTIVSRVKTAEPTESINQSVNMRFVGRRKVQERRTIVTDKQMNKSSAVAEMGDRLATTDMGRKVGLCAFLGELGPHLT